MNGLDAEIEKADSQVARAYLIGALRDGTFSRLHKTIRIAQADIRWLRILQVLIKKLGSGSWIYREGRRDVWVVETTCRLVRSIEFSSVTERIAFVRGYFDAEGGIPASQMDRFYIQFVQKDRADLDLLRHIVTGLGIRCGRIHNPSARVDPNYWRFYVLSISHEDFIRRIGSWHPRKRPLLEGRLPARLGTVRASWLSQPQGEDRGA